MFSKIIFEYDWTGKKFDTSKGDERIIIKASDLRGKSFTIQSALYRGMRENLPCLQIIREYKNIDTDPWVEVGPPPGVMFTMVMPHVDFNCNYIQITGFEKPNMMWAGRCRPAYEWCKPLKLKKSLIWDGDDRHFDFQDLNKQSIILVRHY